MPDWRVWNLFSEQLAIPLLSATHGKRTEVPSGLLTLNMISSFGVRSAARHCALYPATVSKQEASIEAEEAEATLGKNDRNIEKVTPNIRDT